jgi:SOS-response transcriptional repressor LexA
MRDEREVASAMRRLSPIQREIYEFIRRRTIRDGVGPSLRATLEAFPGSDIAWLLRQLQVIQHAGLIGRGSWATGPQTRADAGERRARQTRPG